MADQKKRNNFKSQYELQVKQPFCPLKRGKTRATKVVIGFSFASDLLRKWCKFFWTNSGHICVIIEK